MSRMMSCELSLALSGSLWLDLAHFCTLWLIPSYSGHLWVTLTRYLAHSRSQREQQFGSLFCSESSEVRIENGQCGPDQCFIDDPVPGLLPGTITTRKGFQVLGHCWLRLHLLLGHQGDQACLRQQAQEEDQPFDEAKKCNAMQCAELNF